MTQITNSDREAGVTMAIPVTGKPGEYIGCGYRPNQALIEWAMKGPSLTETLRTIRQLKGEEV